MSPAHKKLCAGLAAALTFFGLWASPLCRGLPSPYDQICLAGGEVAKVGAEHINRNLSADAGR